MVESVKRIRIETSFMAFDGKSIATTSITIARREPRGDRNTRIFVELFYTARKLKSYTIQNSNAPQSPWSEFKLIFPSHVSFPTDESISSTWKLLLYIRHWFLLLISVSFNTNTKLTIFIKWKHCVLYNDLKRKIRFWYPDIKKIMWFTYIGRFF